MDLLLIIVYIFLLILAIQALRLIFADGDLQLMWKERFGNKPDVLRRKVVWITGASTGIGEYLAYEMAKAGCRLVISARSKDLLDSVKSKCLVSGRVSEEDILVLPLDMTDIDHHQAATAKVLETFGQIDVLVNNAGRSQRAWLVDTELAVDREMIELNVIGVISLTKAVLPSMIKRGEGHVVVTGSLAGKMGMPFSATYCLTKFAIQGWFQTLAIEMADKNIKVSIVCPGPVVSNLPNIAFTAKSGQAKKWIPSGHIFCDAEAQVEKSLHGAGTAEDKNRMTTQRCSELMAVAIANKLDEVWITRQPILLLTYINQYAPSVASWLLKKLGVKQVMKMREGR